MAGQAQGPRRGRGRGSGSGLISCPRPPTPRLLVSRLDASSPVAGRHRHRHCPGAFPTLSWPARPFLSSFFAFCCCVVFRPLFFFPNLLGCSTQLPMPSRLFYSIVPFRLFVSTVLFSFLFSRCSHRSWEPVFQRNGLDALFSVSLVCGLGWVCATGSVACDGYMTDQVSLVQGG